MSAYQLVSRHVQAELAEAAEQSVSDTTPMEDEFIRKNGFADYGKWFLAINRKYSEGTKRIYEFSFGDFERVHKCALLAAESGAGQHRHFDIEQAAATLLVLIDNRHDEGAPLRSFPDLDGK
jgi:hypothetical protein